MTTIDQASRKAWNEFLANVEEAMDALTQGRRDGTSERPEFWFRGHARSDYNLLPSLFRSSKDPNKKGAWKKIWRLESDLFWEFSARAQELHQILNGDWDYLFAMQHYRTPTRLLDWTEVLGVAVYFAVLQVDETKQHDEKGMPLPHPCVWILNPYGLNRETWGSDDLIAPDNLGWDPDEESYYTYSELLAESGIDFDDPVAIYPRQLNPRIHGQRAWFTIHGDNFIPLEKIKGCKKYLRKVDLPRQAIPAARKFLEYAGIDHYLLFSDLESLSLQLKEKNRLTAHK